MEHTELWKCYTAADVRERLLSLQLVDQTWPDQKQLACLYAVSDHTYEHYHTRLIPKANGTSRRLQVPDALLKGIQRNILHNCLETLPVSAYARAYRPNLGVRSNASAHVGQPQVFNLDIAHFFDSIDFAMVYRWAFPDTLYPPEIRGLLTSLCCCQGYLPQGAPTSPAISNLVMREFDETIGRWCDQQNITYTRYCDDLTFSGTFDAAEVKQLTARWLQSLGMTLNR